MSQSIMSQHQPSITEWLVQIGATERSNEIREEDNKKADRMETLYRAIGFPYERPEKFEAADLTNPSPEFKNVLDKRGDELCAIRLVPKQNHLPKLRNRGQSIRNCYENWFLRQDINPDDYYAYICPHPEYLIWSSIFVVNKDMIFGEIVRGMHNQLTHGDLENQPLQFQFDYQSWHWSHNDPEAATIIKKIVKLTHVSDMEKQKKVINQLSISFKHDHLLGYFEATVWPDKQIRFTDYSRVLSRYIPTPLPLSSKVKSESLQGTSAYPGNVKGKAIIVAPDDIESVDFPSGSILVCDNTDVRFLPLIRKAAAVVTEKGGLLSHAAIVMRELKKPCLVGVRGIMAKLASGDIIEVDTTNGFIKQRN